MTLTLTLTPEQENRLRALAAANGKPVEDYVLDAALPPANALTQGSPEWKARLRSTYRSGEPLTDEQTRRENFYDDDLR